MEILALKILGGIIAVGAGIGLPLLKLFRIYNKDAAANAKDSSEAFLYTSLKEQLIRNEEALKKAKEENEKLRNVVFDLEKRIAGLEISEGKISEINIKLELKDKELQAKNTIIEERDKKISDLFNIVLEKQEEIDVLRNKINELSNT